MKITLSAIEIDLDLPALASQGIVLWMLVQSRLDRKKTTLQ